MPKKKTKPNQTMQSYLLLGPTAIDGCGSSITHTHSSSSLIGSPPAWFNNRRSCRNNSRRHPWIVSATVNQNHYAVLGVSPDASSSDIKKAFRLLARKYHPDVSKDPRANEVFKSIRFAYETLSNATTRNQYDRDLHSQEDGSRQWRDSFNYDGEFEDGVRIYRWADLRMSRERYWKGHDATEENSSYYYKTDDKTEERNPNKERGSFVEVVRSAFLSLILMRTIGSQLSLTFSSVMAMLDDKLDAGYKVGHMIAWVLGGKGGILLTLCLSFASWVCGKSSSGVVTLVVLAMWVGSNMASVAPIPQGALLTLLYMSIKLQADLT